MATEATQDYSKRQRIINALAVYPDRYEFNADVIAELTDASESYVYRLQRQLEDNEVRDSEFPDVLADDLQESYRDKIEALLDDREAERSIDKEGDGNDEALKQEQQGEEQQLATEDLGTAGDEPSEGTEEPPAEGRQRAQAAGTEAVSEEPTVEQLRAVRETLAHRREAAEFGRENFEGPAADVAHGKYYVVNDAIERLDRIIDDAKNS